MDPGELDKRISIMAVVPNGRDAAGAPITYPTEVASPWAKVIEQSGREFISADGEQTEAKVVFRIWRDDGANISNATVVRYRETDHDVQNVRSFDDVTEIFTVAKAATAP